MRTKAVKAGTEANHLSVSEVARAAGCSPSNVYYALTTGNLQGIRTETGRWTVPVEAAAEWLKGYGVSDFLVAEAKERYGHVAALLKEHRIAALASLAAVANEYLAQYEALRNGELDVDAAEFDADCESALMNCVSRFSAVRQLRASLKEAYAALAERENEQKMEIHNDEQENLNGTKSNGSIEAG